MATASLRIPSRPAAFDAALEGLTRVNEVLLGARDFPPLYTSGVRYKTEPREVWRHVGDVLAEKWGDCEDLAAWRAAELRVSGEDTGASVTTYQSGPRRYHAVVRRGDGTLEDPSKMLGMKGGRKMDTLEGDPESLAWCNGLADAVLGEDEDDGPPDDGGDGGGEDEEAAPQAYYAPEPQAYIAPDPQPAERRVTTDARPAKRGGFRGVARVPFKTGRALLTASSLKPTRALASKAALSLATRALNSPAAQALLPPQARLALNLIRSPAARSIARRIGRLRKIF